MKTKVISLGVPCLFLIFLVIYNVSAQEKYSLDNSADNKCGQTVKIHPDKEIILSSSGRAPKGLGFCSTVVYAVGKKDQNCHGMCMSVTSQYMNVCHAKIQFKGMDFGKDDDPFRELSCFHRLPKEWCFHTNVMAIEVVETYFYANEMSTQSYNFSVKVDPLCDNSPYGKDIENREAARRKSEADARDRARVHGILVGVCLAIMFLILLLITWCYYKNKPFGRDIHSYPTSTVHKRPTFAGLKAKMTFHKASSSEDCEGKTKKEKKHSKDEATVEQEEPKPKKRGLNFLNRLRSSKAEEVPLVEKKKDKPEDVEEINEIKDDNVDKTKDETVDETKEVEKEVTKVEGEDEPVKEKQGEGTEAENVETGDKTSNEPATNKETPSVTVTTPDENDSKNDSSDDS